MAKTLLLSKNGTNDTLSSNIDNNLESYEDAFVNYMLLQPANCLGLVLVAIAIPLNVFCLMGIAHVRGKKHVRHQLIISLGCSDVLICLAALLYDLNNVDSYRFSRSPRPMAYYCRREAFRGLSMSANNASLLTLIVMAFDHYFAIIHAMRYEQIVTTCRTVVTIVSLWGLALITGMSHLYYLPDKASNFCKEKRTFRSQYTTYAIAAISLLTMTVIYMRILVEVRRIQRQMAYQDDSLKHNKKALVTTLLFLGTFLLCWMTLPLLEISLRASRDNLTNESIQFFRSLGHYVRHFLVVNCICDPLIYTIRMKDVREGQRVFFNRICCNKCFKKQNDNATFESYPLRTLANQNNNPSPTISHRSVCSNVSDNKLDDTDSEKVKFLNGEQTRTHLTVT